MFLFSALVALAFTGSIGLLFLFLACALPQFKYDSHSSIVIKATIPSFTLFIPCFNNVNSFKANKPQNPKPNTFLA